MNQMPAPLGRRVVGASQVVTTAPALTPRQAEILREAASGDPYKAIAARLGCSESNVKTHVFSACQRLGVPSLLDAFRVLGWLRVPQP